MAFPVVYLAIGVAIFLAALFSNRFARGPWSPTTSLMTKASFPHPKPWRYNVRKNFLAPSLAGATIISSWPVLTYMHRKA